MSRGLRQTERRIKAKQQQYSPSKTSSSREIDLRNSSSNTLLCEMNVVTTIACSLGRRLIKHSDRYGADGCPEGHDARKVYDLQVPPISHHLPKWRSPRTTDERSAPSSQHRSTQNERSAYSSQNHETRLLSGLG
ncbi:unnamed protein product [Protopolystoma xenopodis]|uniref:Uncharacterized protein n=1 Tax=Protopolystoma xenopodis TaxID=117903 RepID=A0A448XIE3_9PLAT|nr:unnamed protein product [Protopolystoma xenopodis]